MSTYVVCVHNVLVCMYVFIYILYKVVCVCVCVCVVCVAVYNIPLQILPLKISPVVGALHIIDEWLTAKKLSNNTVS